MKLFLEREKLMSFEFGIWVFWGWGVFFLLVLLCGVFFVYVYNLVLEYEVICVVV